MIKRLAATLAVGIIAIGSFAGDCDDDEDSKGKTGGAAFEIGVLRLDLKPVQRIISADSVLNSRGFNLENNAFVTLGLMGFGGDKESGGKVGLGGWVAYNSFYSNSFETAADSATFARTGDSLIDSVDQLHMLVAYGGFIGEKSFSVFPNLRLNAGGLIGAGAQIAIRQGFASSSAFRSTSSDTSVDVDDIDLDVAVAPMWAFDVHGGATYSFTSWMHMGVDAALVMFYSSLGYSYSSGSFFTVNPSLRVRLVFGTAV